MGFAACRAAMNFDGHVGELRQLAELRFVMAGFLGTIRYNRYNHRDMAGADSPQMQIGNSIPIMFERYGGSASTERCPASCRAEPPPRREAGPMTNGQ